MKKTEKSKKIKAPAVEAATAPIYQGTDLRPHSYPMPEELLSVKDYALTSIEGRRYCVLRWVKRQNLKIDKIVFYLYQYDTAGRELDARIVTLADSEIPTSIPQAPFITPIGIKIKQKCAELRIQLIEVISAPYTYTVEEGRVSVDYNFAENWVYNTPSLTKLDRKFEKSKEKLSVRSKRVIRPRLIWLFAVLNVISMIGISFAAIFGDELIELFLDLI